MAALPQIPLMLAGRTHPRRRDVVVALAMMFFVFGQIPINDAMSRLHRRRWRARAYAVRYVVSFLGSAAAAPLVVYTHSTTAGFTSMFRRSRVSPRSCFSLL